MVVGKREGDGGEVRRGKMERTGFQDKRKDWSWRLRMREKGEFGEWRWGDNVGNMRGVMGQRYYQMCHACTLVTIVTASLLPPLLK